MGRATIERARRRAGGFLTRLARDRAGNTLAMMTIALIPLTGMAGSAIDTARVYYVKVRLQQACDAGVLAGRKFMNGTEFNDAAQQQAQAFFANNFKGGTMGSTTPDFKPVKTAQGQVAGTASVTVPMTLMKMAGFAPVALSVACEAKLEIPNLDVMFVLDTTGTMTETNPGDTEDRITGLRKAVVNFYDTLDRARKPGTIIRYGAVPYSANVNVGMLLRPEWLVDNATYQSRRFDQTVTTTSPDTIDNNDWVVKTGSWTKTGGSTGTAISYGRPEACAAPPSTKKIDRSNTGWVNNGNGSEKITYTETINGSDFAFKTVNGRCQITETWWKSYVQKRTDTRSPNPDKGTVRKGSPSSADWWWYEPRSYDVRPLKGNGTRVSGGTINAPINTRGANRTIAWNQDSGCIEERRTVAQSTYTPIPPEAYDLNVDMLPDAGDDDTRWRPWLPGLVYARESFTKFSVPAFRSSGSVPNLLDHLGGENAPCPSPAKMLQPFTRAALDTYVKSLKVGGKTYHDIGFLWGLRLMSREGIFAAENRAGLNGAKTSQHLIFMTDGETQTDNNVYEAYGLSGIDRRRTTTFASNAAQNQEQDTIVANRLLALCDVARRKDITVWVIAFGTTLTPLLSKCTTDGRSFDAKNTDQLNVAFNNIAAQIAKLRVSN